MDVRTRIGLWLASVCVVPAIVVATTQARAPVFASQASPRTIPIKGGTVVVSREDDADHVVMTSSNGEVRGESWCFVADGSYDEFAGLFARLVTATTAHDVEAVAALVQYPLTVNATRARTIKTAAQLKADYDRVFTPTVVKALSNTQVADVFCKNGTAMIANGTVWAAKEKGRVGVFVVNQ